jgi:hypothetical protein
VAEETPADVGAAGDAHVGNSESPGPPEDVEAPGLTGESPGDGAPAPEATPSPSVPDPEPTPPVDEPVDASGLTIETTQSRMLTQVGGRVGFKVHVKNNGADTLEGVAIVSVIPPEMDAGAAQIGPDVEAAFHGASPTSEDIVWILKALQPGDTATLPWTGNVVNRGNLRAVTETQAKLNEEKVQSARTTTYLATAGKRAPHNPTPMVKKRIVTYKTVELPAAEQPSLMDDVAGAPVSGSADPLPLTGSDPKPVILFGLLLIVIGMAFARGAHRDPRKLLIVALLVFAACVDTGSDQASAPKPSPTVEDKVKGTRFERDKNKDNEEPAESATTTTLPFSPEGEPGTEGEPTLVADLPTDTTVVERPTVTSIVRQVRVETVPADLKDEELASRDGDNFLSVEWDEDAGLRNAASSTMLTSDAPVEIQTSLAEKNGAVEADVELRSLREDTRVVVRGVIVQTITSGGSVVATLRSDPFDVAVNPGGTLQAHFSYLLPTGAYDITSAFEAD